MRIIKTLILATAVTAGASAAHAQGASFEAEQAQVIRQSALAFTEQMQDRGFFGVRGVFLPVLTGGFFGDTAPGPRAADDRITKQSLAQRPLRNQRPGSVNNRELLDQNAYREPMNYDSGWTVGEPR